MDSPEVRPFTNPMIKKVILPVQPTAARALTPMERQACQGTDAAKLLNNISDNQWHGEEENKLCRIPMSHGLGHNKIPPSSDVIC